MSTVSVTNVKNASSSVNNAVTTSGGDLTNAAGVSFMGGSKNLLYNGACQIAQRNTSVAGITTGGYYTADRWYSFVTGPTVTQSVESDGPTGSGLTKSLKTLVTTAKASLAAGDGLLVWQSLEGQDVQRIAKGTASAQQVTLSFWVKTNVTGTYVVELDATRKISATYSIAAGDSGNWVKRTVTFAADTTGTIANDNNAGLIVLFWLAAGSNFSGGSPLNTSWGTATTTRATGQVNVAAATNNYWQVTGVQLEVGPVATSFEFKSYGQELRECQRYYFKLVEGTTKPVAVGSMYNNASFNMVVPFPVAMRTDATLSATTGTNYYSIDRNGAADTVNSLTLAQGTLTNAHIYNNTEVSGTAGQAGVMFTNNSTVIVAFQAEL